VRARLSRRHFSLALGPLLILGCQSASSGGSHRPTSVTHFVDAATPPGTAHSQPRRDSYYPGVGTTSIDALHYGLDLTWDGARRLLSGTAAIHFRATHDESKISLDLLSALHVARVRLDGSVVKAVHSGHKLTVTTGAIKRHSHHTVEITYQGRPHPVAAPTTRRDVPNLGWTVLADGQAWTLQEPFGAYTWYPSNDQPSDKAYYDITWHTKAAWSGVSNGQLVSDQVASGQRTLHWHLASPAATYLVTAAIGPYHEYQQTGPHGVAISYWVRDVDKARLTTLRQTPALLTWLEAHLGRYPFDRVGVLVAPTQSSVETQTMVTIGPGVLKQPYAAATLTHELSHQWYGDTVTPYTWKDLWLNESFAMYVQIRWSIAHHLGTSNYWHRILDNGDQQLRNRYGPPGAYDRKQFASANVYYCGARMLYRLQSKLGDRVFAKVLRDWPQQHRYQDVDRNEWINYLDHVTGRHLGHFVRYWLTAKKSPK
jgi:aminopeptidase N